jgi:hypothetical protein
MSKYDGLTIKELKAECKKREIPGGKNKEAFIKRLQDNDILTNKNINKDNKDTSKKNNKNISKDNITTEQINKIHKSICDIDNSRIKLLKQKEVIQWLFDDHSFLGLTEKINKTQDNKKLKELEDKWGIELMKKHNPKLKFKTNWTNIFGEDICKELCYINKKEPIKPKKITNFQPDCETDDTIWEAKIGTYYTSGTAGEKILGTPFKYADIPELYKKPLKILCMGGAEKTCRMQYGNLEGKKTTKQKIKFLEFFKENKIEYIGITDILKKYI